MLGTVIAIVGGAFLGVGLARIIKRRERPQQTAAGISLACFGVIALTVGLVLAAST